MKWNIKSLALILAAVAVGGLTIGGALLLSEGGFRFEPGRLGEFEVDTEKSFAIDGIGELRVRAVSTDLRVHETEGGELRVHFHGRASREHLLPELILDQAGNALYVEIRHRRTFGLDFGYQHTILDLYVPRQLAADVELKTVSGGITVDALRAKELSLATVSGGIAAARLSAGRTNAATVSGDCRLQGITGDLDLHTVSGEARVEIAEFAADITARTTSGDVRFDLPEGSEFTLAARSVSGNISCAFPVAIGERTQRNLSGTVGGGRNRIEINTVSGDVEIF